MTKLQERIDDTQCPIEEDDPTEEFEKIAKDEED